MFLATKRGQQSLYLAVVDKEKGRLIVTEGEGTFFLV